MGLGTAHVALAEKSLEHGRVLHQPARLPTDGRRVLLPRARAAHYKFPGARPALAVCPMYNGRRLVHGRRGPRDQRKHDPPGPRRVVPPASAELSAAFYERMDVVWAGGDAARASTVASAVW